VIIHNDVMRLCARDALYSAANNVHACGTKKMRSRKHEWPVAGCATSEMSHDAPFIIGCWTIFRPCTCLGMRGT